MPFLVTFTILRLDSYGIPISAPLSSSNVINNNNNNIIGNNPDSYGAALTNPLGGSANGNNIYSSLPNTLPLTSGASSNQASSSLSTMANVKVRGYIEKVDRCRHTDRKTTIAITFANKTKYKRIDKIKIDLDR